MRASCCSAQDATRRCPRASRISAERPDAPVSRAWRAAARAEIRRQEPAAWSGQEIVLISRHLWSKVLATLLVVTAFVFLYETRILDSRFGLRIGPAADVGPVPAAGAHLSFSATAYCKGTTTTSGVNVRSGIAAADPALLPVGSVIQVDAPGTRNDGVYTIMDTGPL